MKKTKDSKPATTPTTDILPTLPKGNSPLGLAVKVVIPFHSIKSGK